MARGVLAIALIGTALVVDTRAEAAFDAPKRFLAVVAIAVAAALVFGWRSETGAVPAPWKGKPRRPVLAIYLLLFALGAAFVSALVSPHRALALDTLRAVLVYALLLPLGASRALDRPQPLLAAFLAAAAVNAVVSLLQVSGAYTPFAIRAWGGRGSTGAFAGNVGYLAIALALAALAALGYALHGERRAVRALCALLAALFLAAVVANQNLTALTALVAGSVFLAAVRLGRRSWLPLLALLACLAAAVALYGPLRTRAAQLVSAVRAGDWDRVVTYRAGPWLAAVEMVRERPLTGVGTGAFGHEFVPHRLEAEIRARRRFVNPLVTSSYAEAHSDYLEPFAEIGVLGGAAAAASAGLLLVSLLGVVRRTAGPRRTEAVILAAILIAGATAALTWFPMQRPITALPLLLAAGRGWRLASEEVP
ncbi:MAG: O-antigen ligase family protein [Thermoanaerobaculia bacterium]